MTQEGKDQMFEIEAEINESDQSAQAGHTYTGRAQFVTKEPIYIGGNPGTGKSVFGLYLLHRLLKEYPKFSFIYRHGNVDPGCFIYLRGKSFYHPSIMAVFNDALLLSLLTDNMAKQIWLVLDGSAAIPAWTLLTRPVVLCSGRTPLVFIIF
jgi:hypothetical protein